MASGGLSPDKTNSGETTEGVGGYSTLEVGASCDLGTRQRLVSLQEELENFQPSLCRQDLKESR